MVTSNNPMGMPMGMPMECIVTTVTCPANRLPQGVVPCRRETLRLRALAARRRVRGAAFAVRLAMKLMLEVGGHRVGGSWVVMVGDVGLMDWKWMD